MKTILAGMTAGCEGMLRLKIGALIGLIFGGDCHLP
jgi:hypothetical protein